MLCPVVCKDVERHWDNRVKFSVPNDVIAEVHVHTMYTLKICNQVAIGDMGDYSNTLDNYDWLLHRKDKYISQS